MNKILYYIPFIITISVLLICGNSVTIKWLPMMMLLALFFVSGLLLSKKSWLGGIVGSISTLYIIYDSFANWKLGKEECIIGIIILIYYMVCSVNILTNKK